MSEVENGWERFDEVGRGLLLFMGLVEWSEVWFDLLRSGSKSFQVRIYPVQVRRVKWWFKPHKKHSVGQ